MIDSTGDQLLFFVNALATSSFRNEQLNGKEYIVVPTRMLREGVFTGSKGPIYYSAVENEKSADLWNSTPIVVGHPKKNGKHVSAKSPDVLSKYQVGVVLNSTSTAGDLEAEAWIDVIAADRVDGRIVLNLLSGESISVSTGIKKARMLEVENGSHNGQPYTTTANDIVPDHLAILLDEDAACSIDQGCGLMVNQLSLGNIRMAATSLIRDLENDQNIWISDDDVFSRFVVYEIAGELFKITYSKADNIVKLTGSPIKVSKSVTYRPVLNSRKKEIGMTKAELVETIVNSGCDCWSDDDSDVLESFTVNKLKKIEKGIRDTETQTEIVNSIQEGYEDDHVKVSFEKGELKVVNKEAETAKKEEPVVNNETSPAIKLEQLPAEMQEDIQFARQTRQRQQSEIVNELLEDVADEKKESLQAILNSKSIDELEELRSLKSPVVKESIPNYKGRHNRTAPVANTAGSKFDKSDVLEVPLLSWE